MNEENLYMKKQIFGSIFLLSNKLQLILDRALVNHDLTTKQWFLSAILEEFFESPPTLSEVAEVIGSSRQNVKQIAIKLEEKGFLSLDKDHQDKRAIRLRLTDKSFKFWEGLQQESNQFLEELFLDLEEEELRGMFLGVIKLSEKLKKMQGLEEENE